VSKKTRKSKEKFVVTKKMITFALHFYPHGQQQIISINIY